MTLNIWQQLPESEPSTPVATQAHQPVWLMATGIRKDGADTTRRRPVRKGILVASVEEADGAVALGLVPDTGHVQRNGIQLVPGAFLLRQGDYLQVGDARYWVAATRAPQRTSFDPAVHGEGSVYCRVTRARLSEGMELAVCPGPPGGEVCGALFKWQAWETLVQSPTPFTCPDCGYDPSTPEWTPPPPPVGSTLPQLLASLEETEVAE